MHDEDWKPISTAPSNSPVKVWASLDPSDPLMSWREFMAIDTYGLNMWHTFERKKLRLYPTHWKPISNIPS